MAERNYGMNPEVVKSQGQKLQSNAENFAMQLERLTKYNDQLEQIWKGQTASAYFAKWQEKRESIKRLSNWLKDYANATVSAANYAMEADRNSGIR